MSPGVIIGNDSEVHRTTNLGNEWSLSVSRSNGFAVQQTWGGGGGQCGAVEVPTRAGNAMEVNDT